MFLRSVTLNIFASLKKDKLVEMKSSKQKFSQEYLIP